MRTPRAGRLALVLTTHLHAVGGGPVLAQGLLLVTAVPGLLTPSAQDPVELVVVRRTLLTAIVLGLLCGMSVGEFAERVGISPADVAVPENGRAEAVRSGTLR